MLLADSVQTEGLGGFPIMSLDLAAQLGAEVGGPGEGATALGPALELREAGFHRFESESAGGGEVKAEPGMGGVEPRDLCFCRDSGASPETRAESDQFAAGRRRSRGFGDGGSPGRAPDPWRRRRWRKCWSSHGPRSHGSAAQSDLVVTAATVARGLVSGSRFLDDRQDNDSSSGGRCTYPPCRSLFRRTADSR